MPHALDQSIVRIRAVSGNVVGAGFVVAPRLVVTCAHVVVRALSLSEDGTLPIGSRVRFDFPFFRHVTPLLGTIVGWRPPGPPPNDEDDLAVLEIQTELPEGTAPAPLIQQGDRPGDEFEAFGFRPGHDAGVWSRGRLSHRQASNWIQIGEVSDYEISAGFSGTPVWSPAAGGVVGVVVASERSPKVRAAFVIPCDRVLEACPSAVGQAARFSTGRGRARSSVRSPGIVDDGVIRVPPFHQGTVVPGPYFIDRDEERAEAIGIITSGQGFLLVGDRRSGKTSFLNKLIDDCHEQPGRPLLATRIDLFPISNLSVERFLEYTVLAMIGEMARRIYRLQYADLLKANRAPEDGALRTSWDTFRHIFALVRDRTHETHKHEHKELQQHEFTTFSSDLLDIARRHGYDAMAICYDEANKLPDAMSVRMLTSISETLSSSGLVAIYAASEEMAATFSELRTLDIHRLDLGPFRHIADMEQLLAKYYFGDHRRTADLPISHAALEALWRHSSGKPYLVQLLASASFRRAQREGASILSADHVLRSQRHLFPSTD